MVAKARKKFVKETVVQYIAECRKRLIRCVCVFIISFITFYFFKEKVLWFFIRQVQYSEINIIATEITSVFFVYISMSTCLAILFTLPFFVFEFYGFCSKGMLKKEKPFMRLVMLLSMIMLLIAMFVVHKFILPLGIKFLASYGNDFFDINLNIRIDGYISMITKIYVGGGLLFQLPIVLVILAKVGLINKTMLQKNRKYAIVIIFIIAAIVTPPDIISQIICGTIMMLCYEIVICFMAKPPSCIL